MLYRDTTPNRLRGLLLVLMRPDGKTVKTVATHQACPAYSPDGGHYAFVTGDGAIKYADADGKHARSVVSPGRGGVSTTSRGGELRRLSRVAVLQRALIVICRRAHTRRYTAYARWACP